MGKMFPEELKERCHTVATHVSNLISAQNRLANPFNFSQDRFIVVVRSAAPTFPPPLSLSLSLSLSVSLSFSPPLCFPSHRCRFNSGKRMKKKKQTRGEEREDATAVAPKCL